MPKPLPEVDTQLEQLWPELPDHLVELAYQGKAFVRAGKKTPAERLPVVWSSGGDAAASSPAENLSSKGRRPLQRPTCLLAGRSIAVWRSLLQVLG